MVTTARLRALCRRYEGGQLVRGMVRLRGWSKRYRYRFGKNLFAAPPDAGGYAKSSVRQVLRQERAMGFEPTTSSLGSWHSTTELRPRFFPHVRAVPLTQTFYRARQRTQVLSPGGPASASRPRT